MLIKNKTEFQDKFLIPVSRVAENISLTVKKDGVETIGTTQDGSPVIVYAKYDMEIDSPISRINIPDVKKFLRLLDCINVEELDIEVTSNSLKYKNKAFKFNYFLLEDMYMQRNPINVEKINALTFDCSFELSSAVLGEIIRGSSIATDSNKIYFIMGEDGVYAEINDRERQNINNLTYHVVDKMLEGEITREEIIPLNLESVRLLSGLKVGKFVVKINSSLKVVVFEVCEKGFQMKFIISGLVK